MFNIRKWFLIYGFSYFAVECLIPALHVQKVDKKLIERKRQDTLEMCRMFTEENNRLDSFKIKRDGVVNHNFAQSSKRIKRDLKPANSNLDIGEAKRIETIVDKLYDDMAEHGERVAYRQRNLSTIQAPIVQNQSKVQNQTARRFYFAPASLIPDVTATEKTLKELNETYYVIPWPKTWKHGIVPYFIDPNTYDTQLSDIIIKAFDYFEKATCIRLQRLRERPTDIKSLRNVEWLYITNPSGIRQCVHSNERKQNRGVQMVVFGYDCLSLGEVLHEVMHILGFSHEHTRPDRDQYITVLWDNIKPGYKKYFETRTVDPLSGFSYDYASVMHYPSRAFSRNGQVTLLVESGVKVGQREGLSDNDIAKVTTIYSPECTKRNKEYLLKTCPSVVKLQKEVIENVTKSEIKKYFKDRIWPYGIINYKIKDNTEFTSEERENLNAVIRHIEKETCIEFRDISAYDIDEDVEEDNNVADSHLHMKLNKELISETIKNEADDENIVDSANNKLDPTTTNLTEGEPQSDKQSLTLDTHEADATAGEKIKETEENLVILRTNVGLNNDTSKNSKKKFSSKSSYTFGNLYEKSKNNQRQVHTNLTSAGRRHAESTLTFFKSQEPGCSCPPPGRPKGDQISDLFCFCRELNKLQGYQYSVVALLLSAVIWVIKINSDCFNSVNDLLHLFVHILGLDHQHNMHDRDSYLRILWEKLPPGISNEMQKKLPPAAAVGFPYDYQSVMQYPWLDIKEGVTNIMYPIWNDGWAMGHWQGLSSTDVNKLNLIYFEQCSLRKAHTQEYIVN